MRRLSRLLSVCLALAVLGASVITASAHTTPTANDDYGARLYIELREEKDVVTPGTKLEFFVVVERGSDHGIPHTATLHSVTAGGYTGTAQLGTTEADDLRVGGKTFFTKTVTYEVQTADLGPGATRRKAPIQFRLSFEPIDSQRQPFQDHPATTIYSNTYEVTVVNKAPPRTTDDDSQVEILLNMEPPSSFKKGEQVKFTLTLSTGQYRLMTKPLIIYKQLYDAAGKKIGGSVRAQSFIIRLFSNSVSEQMERSYKLTERDVAAAKIEFSYKVEVTDHDLRDADNTSTDLDDDFEEVFEQTFTIGPAATPTPAPTAVPVVGSSSAARVTQVGNYFVQVDRLDGGQDFALAIGWIAPTGARAYNQRGYIRDDYLGQTYAVVRREADGKVVRIWIAPDSEERYAVPWESVRRNYTVPLNVLLAIPLDEDNPVENQLVRRFDRFDRSGDIYVYRAGAWRHVPDIPTFQANRFYWCNVTAADAGFFSRALIGPPLPRSGTAEAADYPQCHGL